MVYPITTPNWGELGLGIIGTYTVGDFLGESLGDFLLL